MNSDSIRRGDRLLHIGSFSSRFGCAIGGPITRLGVLGSIPSESGATLVPLLPRRGVTGFDSGGMLYSR